MKDYKWTRGLSKSTISNVLNHIPEHVSFLVDWKKRVVLCEITCSADRAYGIAICSCLDDFDPKRGKNIAARRAVLALTEKVNSRYTRTAWQLFPDTWTKKRIIRLQSFGGTAKCIYVRNGGVDSGYMGSFAMHPLHS